MIQKMFLVYVQGFVNDLLILIIRLINHNDSNQLFSELCYLFKGYLVYRYL